MRIPSYGYRPEPAPVPTPSEWPRRLRTGALVVAAWLTWVSAGFYEQRGEVKGAAVGVCLGALFAFAAVVRERR